MPRVEVALTLDADKLREYRSQALSDGLGPRGVSRYIEYRIEDAALAEDRLQTLRDVIRRVANCQDVPDNLRNLLLTALHKDEMVPLRVKERRTREQEAEKKTRGAILNTSKKRNKRRT